MINKIADLEFKILEARKAYYNAENPIVSDQVFDAWIDELKVLDPANKAVSMVGAPLQPSEWKKAKHKIPMGSLDKVNSPLELLDWSKNKNCNKWFVTEKLDGLSIELIYENGKFIQAITRGSNGIEGEDIGSNVIKMSGVLSVLKDSFTGSLRGEIIMTKSNHQLYFKDKANPRNAAVGVSKRLDGVGSDKLNILFYQAIGHIDFVNELDQFHWLEKQQLTTPNYWLFNDISEVNDHWRVYQDINRDQLDYDLDGLVVRINDLQLQNSFGMKDLRPRGAIAFKFDNKARESIIRDVIFQAGNSGRITPVAIIDPIILVGANIERASLYNMSYIQELGLDIGATVLVVRANDIIPKIEKVIKSTGTILKAPVNCSACNSKLEMDGKHLICSNISTCPSHINGRVKNWIKELNLLEWGIILIEKLIESKKINNIADLYKLKINDIANLDRLGEKTAKKCLDILWANNEVPLEVFLGALSIPLIGQSTIKLIINAGCDTLEKFGKLDAQAFEQVPGVGPARAQSLADGLKNNQQLILDLLNNGVTIKAIIQGKLTGCRIAITGSTKTKRADLEKFIVDNGGENKSSVGKSCTHLVFNEKSESSKTKAALKFGIKLISENDLLNFVL